MSNEDEVEELKRLVAEERAAAQAHKEELRLANLERKRLWYAALSPEERQRILDNKRPHNKKKAALKKRLRSEDPEFRDRYNTDQNAYLQRKKEKLAGRPKPVTCEVCSGRGDAKGIVFDHCHNTDKFRGWICGRCNKVLGYVQDDATLLEKLAVYLRSHDAS